jgi:phage head maturation protease
MAQAGPRGWTPSTISHRFSTTTPQSYDESSHSCQCVISAGAPVARIYGTEILQISQGAVDLSRVPVPLLDSHSQASVADVLGRIDEAWISGGQLFGRIVFAQTPRGRLAEDMVSRNELTGVSAGYSVQKWEAVDSDGDAVDPLRAIWDDDSVFTAVRWMLLEASLVGVPADAMASVRSLGSGGNPIADIRARMRARQSMIFRQSRMLGYRDD